MRIFPPLARSLISKYKKKYKCWKKTGRKRNEDICELKTEHRGGKKEGKVREITDMGGREISAVGGMGEGAKQTGNETKLWGERQNQRREEREWDFLCGK